MGESLTDARMQHFKAAFNDIGQKLEPMDEHLHKAFLHQYGPELLTEIERLRKEVTEDDKIIDDLRCAGAKGQTEIKQMWAQFGLIKDILALAYEQATIYGELESSVENFKAALDLAAKEYLAYPKPTSGGVELTDEVIEHLTDKAEAGYDVDKLKAHRPIKP